MAITFMQRWPGGCCRACEQKLKQRQMGCGVVLMVAVDCVALAADRWAHIGFCFTGTRPWWRAYCSAFCLHSSAQTGRSLPDTVIVLLCCCTIVYLTAAGALGYAVLLSA